MSTALQMVSTLSDDGVLRLSLKKVEVPKPGPDEVLVRIEATPINPSDLGVMFGPADLAKAETSGVGAETVLSIPVDPKFMAGVKGRIGQDLTVGNEGAGVVVEAGSGDQAQALLGKTVGLPAGAMYAQFRCVPAKICMPFAEDVAPKDAASPFVNPMTVLGILETMKMNGRKALVHTAAASNLGRMMNKVCLQDGIALVNIVRKKEQADLLRGEGAKYVCNSSNADFMDQLTDALHETGATIAFDATGGGRLVNDILVAMERADARTPSEYSIYGSTTHKQVYIYGALDTSPTSLTRNHGFAWSVSGWLLPPFLQKFGRDVEAAMRERVAREIRTNFKSVYTRDLSLVDALQASIAQRYDAKSTGEKFLICPQKEI